MLSMVVLLIGISFISFLIMQLAPGNYLDILKLNPHITKKVLLEMERQFGLNKPWYVQYYRWVRGILPHPQNWKKYSVWNWRSWFTWNFHSWRAFNFGISFAYREPIAKVLYHPMINTLILAIAITIVSWAIALPLGTFAAVKQGKYFDQATIFYSYIGYAIPDFFLALVVLFLAARAKLFPFNYAIPTIQLISIFAAVLGGFFSLHHPAGRKENVWRFIKGAVLTGVGLFFILLGTYYLFQKANFPIGGSSSPDYYFLSPWGKFWDLLRHLALPTLVESVVSVAYMLRQMRASTLEVLRAEYVTTARAKGVSEKTVVFKHVFRNALNPIITLFGFQLGSLISGILTIEIVMGWPGLGYLIYRAILEKDLYLVMGDVMISGMFLIIGNLIGDILLAWADPRIRYGS
jgi:peptide/nickel transport system permease protein